MITPYLPPAAHIRRGPVSLVTAETAAWLIASTNVSKVIKARGQDVSRAVYSELTALFELAKVASADVPLNASDAGRSPVAVDEATSELLSVNETARLIGITPRSVRRAVAADRLPARTIGGVYAITEHDARIYRNGRKR